MEWTLIVRRRWPTSLMKCWAAWTNVGGMINGGGHSSNISCPGLMSFGRKVGRHGLKGCWDFGRLKKEHVAWLEHGAWLGRTFNEAWLELGAWLGRTFNEAWLELGAWLGRTLNE